MRIPRRFSHRTRSLPRQCRIRSTRRFSRCIRSRRIRYQDRLSLRPEQASTEDLRLALKRYRAFFERLLAV
jgi:hypothetical protein